MRETFYKKDKDGNLLPDELRLNKYGKFLRASSLDGYDIIGQTRKGLENRGFREVSPMNFLDNHTRFGWYSCDMRIATVQNKQLRILVDAKDLRWFRLQEACLLCNDQKTDGQMCYGRFKVRYDGYFSLEKS